MSARIDPAMAWSLAAALRQRSLGQHVLTRALNIAKDRKKPIYLRREILQTAMSVYLIALVISILPGRVRTVTHASSVKVDWSACSLTRKTAVSMLVAADPEWIPSGILSRTAVDGVKSLSEAGGDNLRLLDFNIFPLMSCAQVAYSGVARDTAYTSRNAFIVTATHSLVCKTFVKALWDTAARTKESSCFRITSKTICLFGHNFPSDCARSLELHTHGSSRRSFSGGSIRQQCYTCYSRH